MNSILQTIFSEFSNRNVATEDYAKSYSDFIKSKMEPFNACKVLIASGLDSYEAYQEIYGEIFNNFPGQLEVMLSDGTAIMMQDIDQMLYFADMQARELCQDGEDIYEKYYELVMTTPIYSRVQGSLERADLYLQDIIDDMANMSLTNEAYQTALQSIVSEDIDPMGMINRVTSAIKDKYPTSDSISNAVDRVVTLINEAPTGRVLLQSIMADLSASFLINDDGDDYSYVIRFNDESLIYKLTGCTPAAAWWTSLNLNVDWSGLAESLKTIGITFYTGCVSFFTASVPGLINKINRFIVNKWTGREIFLEASESNSNAFQIPLIDCTIDDVPTAIEHFMEDDFMSRPYENLLQGMGYNNSLVAVQSILTNVSNVRDTIFNNECFTVVMNRLGGNSVDEMPVLGHAYHTNHSQYEDFSGERADYFRLCFVSPNPLNQEKVISSNVQTNGSVTRQYATMEPSNDKIISVSTVYPTLAKDCFLPGIDETFQYRLITFKLTYPSMKKYGPSSITMDIGACGHLTHSTADDSPNEGSSFLIPSGWSEVTAGGFPALDHIQEVTGDDGIAGTSGGICTIYNDGKIALSTSGASQFSGFYSAAKAKINNCSEDKDYSMTAIVQISLRANPSNKSILNASVRMSVEGVSHGRSSWMPFAVKCDNQYWTNLIAMMNEENEININVLTEALGVMFRHGNVSGHTKSPWIVSDVSVYAGSWTNPEVDPGVLTIDAAKQYPVAYNAITRYWMHDIGKLRIRVFPKILHWPSTTAKKEWVLSSLHSSNSGSYPRVVHNENGTSARYEGDSYAMNLAEYFNWVFNEGDDSIPVDATDKELTLAYAYNAKRALLWLFLLAYGQADDGFMGDDLMQAIPDPNHLAQTVFELSSSHFRELGSMMSRHFDKTIIAHSMYDSESSIFVRNNATDLPDSNKRFLHSCGMNVDESAQCGIDVIGYNDIVSSDYTRIRDKRALERIIIGSFLTCGLMHDSSRSRLASYGTNTLFVPYQQGVFNMSPKYLLASDDDSKRKFINFLATSAISAVVIGGGIAIGVSVFKIGHTIQKMNLDIAHLGREYSKAGSLSEKKAIYKQLCALSKKKKTISGIQAVFGLWKKPFSALAGLIAPKDKDESEMDADVLNMMTEINLLNNKIGFSGD